jgi:nondiscriminating glutamyl-tRNA synthetase
MYINDLARGTIDFDLKNFSDFPLTRANGTFTFIFANAVDDVVMNISHIIRGEDHISNTPCQAALFEAFQKELPTFWHMPIICNLQGKKLSKRDFGFSLQDLKNGGFLPEAINNYLAIIGGSFTNEIMDIQELIRTLDFESIHSTSAIRYDVEKLTWINHQWITRYTPENLAQKMLPFIQYKYPHVSIEKNILIKLTKLIQPELKRLDQAPALLSFYIEKPIVSKKMLAEHASGTLIDAILALAKKVAHTAHSADEFYTIIGSACKEQEISSKIVWRIIRIVLTGSPSGPGIKELVELLGMEETKQRIESLLSNK